MFNKFGRPCFVYRSTYYLLLLFVFLRRFRPLIREQEGVLLSIKFQVNHIFFLSYLSFYRVDTFFFFLRHLEEIN